VNGWLALAAALAAFWVSVKVWPTKRKDDE